ncbi:hypothetical protein [Geomicrobium sp. JCM 19039]|uniref:hypothetical protein n=1 Tax=Geomicrobium sp. JCM 19039 TaxID=1460636 RepID=UPI00045F2A5B|nr:hypothetical protein [Geomicrobium sp. JCM 19039]GAK11498.1 hypothetical protein JCM19039_1196 [Geomicrobium sp. JCM 19039]
MKKWAWILAILAIIVAVYYDLSRGSLPVIGSEETTVEEEVDDEEDEDLDENVFYDDTVAIEVEPGQSLLTIIEQLHEDGYDAPVDHVKSDFEHLNDGILSDEIRAGDVYTFPIYEN